MKQDEPTTEPNLFERDNQRILIQTMNWIDELQKRDIKVDKPVLRLAVDMVSEIWRSVPYGDEDEPEDDEDEPESEPHKPFEETCKPDSKPKRKKLS